MSLSLKLSGRDDVPVVAEDSRLLWIRCCDAGGKQVPYVIDRHSVVSHRAYTFKLPVARALKMLKQYIMKPLDALREKVGIGTEIGSTRSYFVENLLWKRLWTCRKTYC
jgi:hypothetical protein